MNDRASSTPDSLPLPSDRLVDLHIVLVEPEIAGNVGAIGRTCVAVGATLWLVRPLGFLLDDRRIRRTGLDYWQHLDYRVVDGVDEVEAVIGPGRLWYFTTKAETVYTDTPYQQGDALVFGPESRGLPERLLSHAKSRAVRIPMRAEARSLNLANSVAVGLYEALRQVSARKSANEGDVSS